MNTAGRYRTLVESQLFSQQLAKLGTRDMDNVLSGLLVHIATRPEEFDLVPGTEELWLAKSPPFHWQDTTEVFRLRMWFRVDPDDDQIELLSAECTPWEAERDEEE